MKAIRSAILLLLCFAWCADIHAQRKSDIVTLYNGDRITGEIKSLSGGILTYSTDTMGTVSIEWQEIAGLESRYHYDIRLSDGSRYFGSFEAARRPGELLVAGLEGEHELDWLRVVELRAIEDTLLDRLDVYLAAGYSFNKASSVAQTTFNTTVSYENTNSRNTLSVRSSVTDTDEETTSSTRANLNRAVWTDRSKIFRASFASYETNDELALDHRFGVGAGLGRYFIDNYRTQLTGSVGLQVITENKSGSGEGQNVEGILATRFKTWKFKTPELDLDFGFSLYPSFTDGGRVRGDSDLRLRWEIIEDLFFDITAYGTFDNESETTDEFDYGVTTGIGWKY